MATDTQNGSPFPANNVPSGGGTLELDVSATASPLALTATQRGASGLIFSGTRSAALDVQAGGNLSATVRNRTAQTLNVLPASGSSAKVVLANGDARPVFVDGNAIFSGALLVQVPMLPVTSGLILYLRADSLSLTNNSAVTAWVDESGLGNNAAQATGTNQPLFISSAQNGKPAVRFDGSNDFLTIPNAASLGVTELTAFVVYKSNSSGTTIMAKRNTDASINYALYAVGSGGSIFRFSAINAGASKDYLSTLGTSGYQMFSLTVSNTTNQVNFWKSGTTDPSNPQTLVNPLATNTSPLYLGVQNGSSGFNSYFSGDILEIVLYSQVLSATDRQSVESYLTNKYAL